MPPGKDSDRTRAADDPIRHDSIEADARQHQRQEPKESQELGNESLLNQCSVDLLLESVHAAKDDTVADLFQDLTNLGCKRVRIVRRPDFDGLREPGTLGDREVDHPGGGVAQVIVFRVLDHAHYLYSLLFVQPGPERNIATLRVDLRKVYRLPDRAFRTEVVAGGRFIYDGHLRGIFAVLIHKAPAQEQLHPERLKILGRDPFFPDLAIVFRLDARTRHANR